MTVRHGPVNVVAEQRFVCCVYYINRLSFTADRGFERTDRKDPSIRASGITHAERAEDAEEAIPSELCVIGISPLDALRICAGKGIWSLGGLHVRRTHGRVEITPHWKYSPTSSGRWKQTR